jgi:hypothetical protein
MKAALYLFASTAFDCSPFAAVDEPASDSIDVLLAQIHRLERASLVRLLEIFAEHLSLMATHIPLHERNGDSRIVSLAKDYIVDHKSDPIKFEQIARDQCKHIPLLQEVQTGNRSNFCRILEPGPH